MKEMVKFSFFLFNKYQFLRFLVVGGINTVFGYGCFVFFIFCGIHYSLAALMSTVCGILFNFKTTGAIVFSNKDNKLLLKFFIVYGICYFCSLIGLTVFKLFNINYYLSGAILLFPMALLSFILNKFFVFNQNSEEL